MSPADVSPASRGSPSKAGNRRACLIFLFLWLVAQAGFALEITTTDGKIYSRCEIVKVEPDALRIIHADGAARIPYEKLPASLQKQYFDPAKVEAYRQQVAEAQQAAAIRAAEVQRQQAEAAARAEEARAQQTVERQHEEEEQQAADQRAETGRRTTQREKGKMVLGLMGAALVVCLFLYFLPTIIARHKANALAIFVFNVFFGWTIIGWIAALIWACTKDSAMDELARQHLNMAKGGGPLPSSRRFRDAQLPDEGPYPDGRQLGEGRRFRDEGPYLD